MPNLNDPNDKLIACLSEYQITLPRNAIEWRLCYAEGDEPLIGEHILHGLVRCLMTDGVVAWFLLGDHETLFFGHLSNFESERLAKEYIPRATKPKQPSKRQLALTKED
jgi:hypothetical protein